MPGAFAHIAAVSHLLAGNKLKEINVSKQVKYALTNQNEFCFMGAVSPDYPYLVPRDKASHAWADAIHIGGEIGQLVAIAVREIQKILDKDDKARATAWLMGFVAHVGMDMTIHPVVEEIAGKYSESEANRKKHRLCEMHQDVHIWQTLGLGKVGEADGIKFIRLCGDEKTGKVHPIVEKIWTTMLSETYPELRQLGAPDINKWHQCFYKIVDVVEESHKFVPWARHVSVGAAATYPTPDEIDAQFITNLVVPDGTRMHYDDIFHFALQNVIKLWETISVAFDKEDPSQLAVIGSWNLDRGMDKEEKDVIFWA